MTSMEALNHYNAEMLLITCNLRTQTGDDNYEKRACIL